MALYGGPLPQTQSMSLYGQLRAGVRALDIRCRHVADKYLIHHGPVYQRANFDHVLTCVTSFLGSNPSEVILMRLKEEHVPINNTRTFADTFDEYINLQKYRHYFWRGNDSQVMLGQVRGKIVLLRDFPSKTSIGIPWTSLDCQDEYIVPTLFSIGNKWAKVYQHFEKSKNNRQPVIMANFLSGVSAGAFPFSVARRINRYALEWLIHNQVDRVGLIYMDFPGEGIIQAIIDLNSPMQVKNSFDEKTLLAFSCSSSDEPDNKLSNSKEIILANNLTYRFNPKIFGSNKCKFWTSRLNSSLTLDAGNENLFINEFGFYRQRGGFSGRQLLRQWPSL